MRLLLLTLITTLLAACAKEPPNCSSNATFKIARSIIMDKVGGSDGITDAEIEKNLKFNFARASAYDEKIKKYSCTATLVAGDSYSVPINYESQLDDQKQQIVSVNGVLRGDWFGIQNGLIQGIKNDRASNTAVENKKTQPHSVSTEEKAASVHTEQKKEMEPPVSSSEKWAPSFDCAKATTSNEKLICSNQKLSVLDVALSQSYKSALNNTANQESLKTEQRTWLKNELNKCNDVECLEKTYRQRIEKLKN